MTVTRAEANDAEGHDELEDSPTTGETTVIEAERVRLVDPSFEVERSPAAGGAVAAGEPFVEAHPRVLDLVRVGDRVSLEPRSSQAGAFDGLEIASIDRVMGRRARPLKAHLFIEGI